MKDSIVVDASVTVKWVVPEDYSESSLKLRNDFFDGRLEIHAPSILLLEVASALRKYCLKGLVDRGLAASALELIAGCGIKLHEVDPSSSLEIFKASLDFGVTVYDAAYVTLASSLRTLVYTADDKLAGNPALRMLNLVKHVKEYPAHV